ncbi:MAG TPA: GNAT family N-acetyltransferase [Acidimicrobiia bacterium]|nr:GNAT family N-acetyltransferase [Acidimicrobiia bacterium]
MADRLHMDGIWPGPLTVRRGWARVSARPWNDDGPDLAVRLIRGSHDFLGEASRHLSSLAIRDILSPALYPSATRVWARAGYSEHTSLSVMERHLAGNITEPGHLVKPSPTADWPALVRVDRAAFDVFWRMSVDGLTEALNATPRSVLLQIEETGDVVGYAIVGTQLTVSFLQRVAVLPDRSGNGLGGALIRASMLWARSKGARTMILNVRPENTRAVDVYAREGFAHTGSALRVLRFGH